MSHRKLNISIWVPSILVKSPKDHLLKQTLEKSLTKNLDDREGGAGFDRDGVAGFARESREGLPSKEFCDVSFKPTLNEGCTGDSQVEKEAEKLALLDPSKKFAD